MTSRIVTLYMTAPSFKIHVSNVNVPAGLDLEVHSLRLPVDGGDGPGDADAQEDVDGVGARHVAHRVVRAVVADGRHLGREGVCAKGEKEKLWPARLLATHLSS